MATLMYCPGIKSNEPSLGASKDTLTVSGEMRSIDEILTNSNPRGFFLLDLLKRFLNKAIINRQMIQ